MYRSLVLSVIFFVFGLNAFTQTFFNYYENYYWSIHPMAIQTLDSNFILRADTGHGSFGYNDNVEFMKISREGAFQWKKSYHFDDFKIWNGSLTQLGNGHLAVLGTKGGGSYLMIFDENADSLFSISYDGINDFWFGSPYPEWDELKVVREVPNYGLVMVGEAHQEYPDSNSVINQADFFMLFTDYNGDTLWSNYFGGLDIQSYSDVAVGADTSFMVIGVEDSSLISDIVIHKYNKLGNLEWSKEILGPLDDELSNIQFLSDGNYLACGFSQSFNMSNKNSLVMYFDANGDTIWTLQTNESYYNVASICGETQDNQLFVSGSTHEGTSLDVYLKKLDFQGNVLWEHTYGNDSLDEAILNAQPTYDGGYMLFGRNFDTDSVFLILTDSEGNIETTTGLYKTPYFARSSLNVMNPVNSDQLQVNFLSERNSAKAYLMDIMGKVFWQGTIYQGINKISLPNMGQGNYILNIPEERLTKKVIISMK